MRPIIPLLAAPLLALSAPSASAELIVYKNTASDLQTLEYYLAAPGIQVLGQTLDITKPARDQPEPGLLPAGSVLIMWTRGPFDILGEFIYAGPGWNTRLAIDDESGIAIDPPTGAPIEYSIFHDFDDRLRIGGHDTTEFSWFDAWVCLHADVDTAGPEGVYFTDESFIIGVEFEIDDVTRYGFIEMERTEHIDGESHSIKWMPRRWGYESEPGVPVDLDHKLLTWRPAAR
jgi:hypothetical protein